MVDKQQELSDKQGSATSEELELWGMGQARSQWNRFVYGFSQHKLGVAGFFLMVIFVLVAIFAPVLSPHDPNEVNLQLMNKPPTKEHLLGTDGVGRDMLSRLIIGSRVSLTVGVVAVGIYCVLGIIIGGTAGFFGGKVDMLISRFIDVMMCFPSFMLIITVASVLSPSIFNVMIIIGVFGWTGVARLIRGQILSLREQDFVLAAESVGVKSSRILFRHIFPNAMTPVIVAATMGLAGAIMAEAGLSFLGLGVQEPNPSWGSMLQTAMGIETLQNRPWRWIPPSALIASLVLATNFFGDGLRDALDPHMARIR